MPDLDPHPRYPNVFSPIRLGPVEVPSRFFFAPHGSALSAGTMARFTKTRGR